MMHPGSRGRLAGVALLVGTTLLLSGCGLARPAHATALDALTEWPGTMDAHASAEARSARILQQQPIAGGWVFLYLYEPPGTEEPGVTGLASTFVTQVGKGWRAQSSGTAAYERDRFVAAYTVGGNVTPLTTAYGTSPKGSQVRVAWSDGQVTVAPLQNGSFLVPRAVTLQVERVDLLDEGETVLSSRSF